MLCIWAGGAELCRKLSIAWQGEAKSAVIGRCCGGLELECAHALRLILTMLLALQT